MKHATSAPPTGGACATCVPRVSLVWSLPACASIAVGPVGPVVWLASAVASLLEGALWTCHQSKDMRRMAGGLRQVPFPLRLFALCVFQLGCMLLWPGLTRTGIGDMPFAARTTSAPLPAVAIGNTPLAVSRNAPAPPVFVASQLGRDLAGRPFAIDADPATLMWSPKTISVVLPCAEEREYALKTAKSVFYSTPAEVLEEIIVVDDGSKPPLSKTVLNNDMQRRYKIKVLRHEQTVGLIGAKKTGGDAAVGDIVVFFDCHVAPQTGWHQAFLRLIGENNRRLVVPQITTLDIDTWTQRGGGGGMAKCYLTWDADFKWFDSDDMYVAVISGGLLGMARSWWAETGGYDVQMLGWGGENLDQSLRMWLCGGEIVAASDSYVAHMWRVAQDKRTQSHYNRLGDTNKNRARAVYAWYGEFAEKLKDYPNFARRLANSDHGLPWYGNLSNILEVKERLKCRPFSWFLKRFKHLYEDAGMIPKQVFMLREEKTGQCLRFEGGAGTSGSGFGTVGLAACSPETDDRLFWHMGNAKRTVNGLECCSGLRAWNTDQCLQDSVGNIKTGVCDVSGTKQDQHWRIAGDKGELQRGSVCATISGAKVVSKPCPSTRGSPVFWSRWLSREPLEWRLYREAQEGHPEIFASLKS